MPTKTIATTSATTRTTPPVTSAIVRPRLPLLVTPCGAGAHCAVP
ncbi:hypothetical protein [Mumia sp. zg.B21]|nr:hypothetical protein [Mumia sp. zg.B21]